MENVEVIYRTFNSLYKDVQKLYQQMRCLLQSEKYSKNFLHKWGNWVEECVLNSRSIISND